MSQWDQLLPISSTESTNKRPKQEKPVSQTTNARLPVEKTSAAQTSPAQLQDAQLQDTQLQDAQATTAERLSPSWSEVGEPTRPQHLQIDFSPSDADSVAVRKRCADFWKYLETRPDLQKLIVDPVDENENTVGTIDAGTNISEVEKNNDSNEALVWMQDRILHTLPSLPLSRFQMVQLAEIGVIGSSMVFKPKGSSSYRFEEFEPDESKRLCLQMEEFDQKHPRSFEEPTSDVAGLITAEYNDMSRVYQQKK